MGSKKPLHFEVSRKPHTASKKAPWDEPPTHPGEFFIYGKEPKGWHAPDGSIENDFWYFTKYNGRVEGVQEMQCDPATKIFTVLLTKACFDEKKRANRLPDTYDNYRGTKYAVRYKVVKPK